MASFHKVRLRNENKLYCGCLKANMYKADVEYELTVLLVCSYVDAPTRNT